MAQGERILSASIGDIGPIPGSGRSLEKEMLSKCANIIMALILSDVCL